MSERYRGLNAFGESEHSRKALVVHRKTAEGTVKDLSQQFSQYADSCAPRDSVLTYDSTFSIDDSTFLIDEDNILPSLGVPPIPATPREFAELFPSVDRLHIQHDDSTLDGNMNLRVDTQAITSDGKKRMLTLFHLRMTDLKSRHFSLQRYARNSGHEVCRTVRKCHSHSFPKDASLQRAFSNALFTLHASRSQSNSADFAGQAPVLPTNTIKISFGNYAHVDLTHVGAMGTRYAFEYWGISYVWLSVIKSAGNFTEVSFHLRRADSKTALAHIVAVPLSKIEAFEEELKGGWVPPCSMWITNPRVFNAQEDLADVIIATGLVALIDTSIKRHFHYSPSQLSITTKNSPFNFESAAPKYLIDKLVSRISPSSVPAFVER